MNRRRHHQRGSFIMPPIHHNYLHITSPSTPSTTTTSSLNVYGRQWRLVLHPTLLLLLFDVSTPQQSPPALKGVDHLLRLIVCPIHVRQGTFQCGAPTQRHTTANGRTGRETGPDALHCDEHQLSKRSAAVRGNGTTDHRDAASEHFCLPFVRPSGTPRDSNNESLVAESLQSTFH